MKIILSISLLMLLILSSCFKEDEKLPALLPGELEAVSVVIGDDYQTQAFYDLTSNSIISSNPISQWDLAFACNEDQWHIVLNSALMMHAGNTQDTTFNKTYNPDQLTMNYDASSGTLDSNAIGLWYDWSADTLISKRQVYVIDRGQDKFFEDIGYKKIQIEYVKGDYVLHYSNLDGTEEASVIINKDQNYNYIFFSFDNGLLNVEPAKDSWSLKFTKYTTLLYTDEGEEYPYLLVGVLLNPNQVSVAQVSGNFDDIVLSDTASLAWSNQQDIIGWNWKFYDFDTGNYSIVAQNNYIIRNNNQLYYKFHFTSFYGETGEKGTIVFEQVRL